MADKLDLHGKALREVPDTIPSSDKIRELDLENNNIEVLKASLIFNRLPNLRVLKIAKNPLKKIDLAGVEKVPNALDSLTIDIGQLETSLQMTFIGRDKSEKALAERFRNFVFSKLASNPKDMNSNAPKQPTPATTPPNANSINLKELEDLKKELQEMKLREQVCSFNIPTVYS